MYFIDFAEFCKTFTVQTQLYMNKLSLVFEHFQLFTSSLEDRLTILCLNSLYWKHLRLHLIYGVCFVSDLLNGFFMFLSVQFASKTLSAMSLLKPKQLLEIVKYIILIYYKSILIIMKKASTK